MPASGDQRRLVEERVTFKLIAYQRFAAGLHRLFDLRHAEIGDADVTRKPVALGLDEDADRLGKRKPGTRPVQQQQIDLAQAQPRQTLVHRAIEFARSEMRRPDLRCYEHFVALDARPAQPLAHLALVVIHFGGVDVPVAETQCLLDDAGANAAAQLPSAEPEQGNAGAFDLDGRNARSRRDYVGHIESADGTTLMAAWRRAPQTLLRAPVQ